jgi:uncharacterized protein (DUF2235 family)
MPKNIVIFSDGTGQDGGSERNTNVYRLFNMTEQRTEHQVCFYDPGVGSTGLASRLPGMAGGVGFGRNVRDCYTFIFDNYQSGDRLFLIGFSRGAATVRSLAAFIHMFGILPPSRRGLIGKAWGIYQIRDPEKRRKRAEEFIGHHVTMWTKVHFLGCYDTVAALGLPFQWASRLLDRVPWMRHRFHDFRLSPGVVHAYHALALDDRRTTFHPVLWDALEEERSDPTGKQRGVFPLACRTMRQVWFPGAHTDVGGGYEERGLSDITLVWLTRAAVSHGLRLFPGRTLDIREDPDGHMHDSCAGFPGRLYRRKPRFWDEARPDRPIVHETALLRRKSVANGDDPAYEAWTSRLNVEVEVERWVPFDGSFGPAPAPTAVPAGNVPEGGPPGSSSGG